MTSTTIPAEKLRDALKFAAPFTTRSPLPLTECVLITIAGGQMKVECTDLDSHAQITVPGIDGELTAMLPIKRLTDAIAVADQQITLRYETEKSLLHLKSNGLSARFPCLDPETFPRIDVGSGKALTVDDPINEMVQRVAFSAAVQDVRYYLIAVLLARKGGQISAVCTDGHRLAAITRPSAGPDFEVLVPVSKMRTVAGLGLTKMTVRDRFVVFSDAAREITVKLIDGKFPDWRRVLGTAEDAAIVTAARADLLRGIAAASIVQREKVPIVKTNAADGKLTLLASDAANNNAEYAVPCEGDVEQCGYQTRFFSELIEESKSEQTKLLFTGKNGERRAEIIEQDDDTTWHSVMMAYRI